jgi:hypothetical protein
MKKTYIITIVSLLLFFACKEDEAGGVIPQSISGVTATADYGAVILKWKIPNDLNFSYVDITWTGSNGKLRRIQSTHYAADPITSEVSVTLDGFTDTKPYTFTLTSYSVTDTPGTSIQVSAASLQPAYDVVIETVTIESDFGGIIVNWKNPTHKEIYVDVTYLDADGKEATKTFSASETSGKQYLTGIPAGETLFAVTARDKYQNHSKEKPMTADVMSEVKFDKKKWVVPGYNADSNQETIGYSSQATNEGASNKIPAIFDDNVTTFWHARWSSPATDYPHWYIIDLGAEVTISRIEMTKRQGNSAVQKGQTFYTCSEAGITNQDDPERGYAWENQGSYPFVPTDNNAQSYRLVNNPKARYIKVYFGLEMKGSGNYAMVGEMSVYGQE